MLKSWGRGTEFTCISLVRKRDISPFTGPRALPPTSACSPPTCSRRERAQWTRCFHKMRPNLDPPSRQEGGEHPFISIWSVRSRLPIDSRFQRPVVRARRRYPPVRPPSPPQLGGSHLQKGDQRVYEVRVTQKWRNTKWGEMARVYAPGLYGPSKRR